MMLIALSVANTTAIAVSCISLLSDSGETHIDIFSLKVQVIQTLVFV
jgi:hypothetical protein